MAISFKDKMRRDRDRLFLNPKHFSDFHTVLDEHGNRYEIAMRFRYTTLKEQGDMLIRGIAVGEAHAIIKVGDIPRKPSAGDIMEIDGVKWEVTEAKETGIVGQETGIVGQETGMYEIYLTINSQY